MSSEGATIDHETDAAADAGAGAGAVDQTAAPEPAAAEHGHPHHPDDGVGVKVEDPLAGLDNGAALDAGEEAAAAAMEAAAAAEACLGNVLDDVSAGVVAAPAHRHPDDARGHQPEHGDDDHEPTPVSAAGAIVVGGEHVLGLNPHHDLRAPGSGDLRAQDPTDAVDVGGEVEDDEVALAAAAAAAAVQAADGMAVVVDQALLATAAAAAASQVAEVLAEHSAPSNHGMHGISDAGGAPPPLPDVMAAATQQMLASRKASPGSILHHGEGGDLLEQRREKDRKRYSAMTPEARASYNAHRRELYHKQGEAARKRRRERERDRYHSLEGEAKKARNDRRAKLERDRYNRLSKEELAARNAKRRERAKQRKMQAKAVPAQVAAEEMAAIAAATIPPPPRPAGIEIKPEAMAEAGAGETHHLADGTLGEAVVGAPLPEATVDVGDAHAMADASALAAEVAEQVIAGTNLEGAMEAVAVAAPAHEAIDKDGPTVQI